jgi:hypothetical protein
MLNFGNFDALENEMQQCLDALVRTYVAVRQW